MRSSSSFCERTCGALTHWNTRLWWLIIAPFGGPVVPEV